MFRNLILILFILNVAFCAVQDTINPKIIFENVHRAIDLSSQIAKIVNKITVKNDGTSSVNYIVFTTGDQKASPAFLLAQVHFNLS